MCFVNIATYNFHLVTVNVVKFDRAIEILQELYL